MTRAAPTSDRQQLQARWAVELLEGFVSRWTAPGAAPLLADDLQRVREAIVAIAPKSDDERRIGWAVFQRHVDLDYDRERPSGYVHTMTSAVFENPAQAHNALQSRRDRDGTYLTAEILETP